MQNIFTKIYTWSHKYYNLRLPWWLFRYSAKLHVQSGKCSKTKNAHGTREIAFAAIFISQIICWVLHLKEKQTTFLHYHTAYDYRKGSKSRWYTTARCWYTTSKQFFPKVFTNPDLLLTNVIVYDKPNWTHHFQVARHFGRLYSTIGGLYRRAT